jgi:hypothetical protein
MKLVMCEVVYEGFCDGTYLCKQSHSLFITLLGIYLSILFENAFLEEHLCMLKYLSYTGLCELLL